MPHKDKNSQSRKRGKDKQKDRYNKYGKYNNRSTRIQTAQKINDRPESIPEKSVISNKKGKN